MRTASILAGAVAFAATFAMTRSAHALGPVDIEVGAIVGMSPAMVRHYAKEVRRHHLAINAMKKLETGWADIRKNVLGATRTS